MSLKGPQNDTEWPVRAWNLRPLDTSNDMLTHDDKDQRFQPFMDKLLARADRMREQKLSEITAGKEGEPELARWNANGIEVVVRPNDPQGILRISVGGGDQTPVPLNYCTIRGDVGACISLLEQAIRALRKSP